MLIFRDAPGVTVGTADFVRGAIAGARALAASPCGPGGHDAAISLAIDLGMLEAAIADAVSNDRGEPHPAAVALRRASVHAAHACLASWHDEREGVTGSAGCLADALARVDLTRIPEHATLRTPEGFAYYGLYPETYAAAARAARAALPAPITRAACLGIRSIGTTLSAFAVAALEREGCQVASWTVRPHGHPFNRRADIGPGVARLLLHPAPELVLIADEGPGLSGSSFAAAAAAIETRGVPRDRVVFLPAWNPDGSQFTSAAAAAVWLAHRRVSAPFERVWVSSGRLSRVLDAAGLEDISAGAWRKVWTVNGKGPAVQTQHERRKYLARPAGGPRARFAKFGGLGRFGARLLDRAARLHGTAALTPAQLSAGFLVREAIEGELVAPGVVPDDLLCAMARYIAAVASRFPAGVPADRGPLLTMVETNVRGAFPGGRLSRLASVIAAGESLPQCEAALLDARMLPHDWISTARGYVKADALEHHDDHFFPGPQDPAWDVAGTTVEFRLDSRTSAALVEAVSMHLADPALAARVPFYRVAYLAFRAGYCAIGAQALGEHDDGRRLAAAAARYREELRPLVG